MKWIAWRHGSPSMPEDKCSKAVFARIVALSRGAIGHWV